MYPGYPIKNVSMSGSAEEWLSAAILYKNDDRHLYMLDDGHDRMRHLTRLAIQHDEGFLYLLLETACTISMCSKPKKPQRKPKPSATDVSAE